MPLYLAATSINNQLVWNCNILKVNIKLSIAPQNLHSQTHHYLADELWRQDADVWPNPTVTKYYIWSLDCIFLVPEVSNIKYLVKHNTEQSRNSSSPLPSWNPCWDHKSLIFIRLDGRTRYQHGLVRTDIHNVWRITAFDMHFKQRTASHTQI